MARRDLACAALGLALAVAYWLGADALPKSMLADGIGADGVPKALGLLLGALSIAIGVRAFLRPEAAQGSPDFVRALGIAALGALYTALAPFLGYLLAMTLLVGAATVYYGAKPRPMVAAFSVGTAALLWLLFAAMLGVALPRSALF